MPNTRSTSTFSVSGQGLGRSPSRSVNNLPVNRNPFYTVSLTNDNKKYYSGEYITGDNTNLTIASGSTQALIFTGANAAFQGDLSVTGGSTLDGVTITDNTIKSNASNADLQIGTSGTGVIDILTATQTTVGSAGGANALPGTPTGYIKVKIGGTMRVIPFYDES